jgi:hypothetical protein
MHTRLQRVRWSAAGLCGLSLTLVLTAPNRPPAGGQVRPQRVIIAHECHVTCSGSSGGSGGRRHDAAAVSLRRLAHDDAGEDARAHAADVTRWQQQWWRCCCRWGRWRRRRDGSSGGSGARRRCGRGCCGQLLGRAHGRCWVPAARQLWAGDGLRDRRAGREQQGARVKWVVVCGPSVRCGASELVE